MTEEQLIVMLQKQLLTVTRERDEAKERLESLIRKYGRPVEPRWPGGPIRV